MTDDLCPTNNTELYQTVGELKGMTMLIHQDLQDIKKQAPNIKQMEKDIAKMQPVIADYTKNKQRFIGASFVTGIVSGVFAVVSAFFALFGVHLPNPFNGS